MSKKKLSYSTAKKLLDELPEVAVYKIDNPSESSPAMELGKNIEAAFMYGIDQFVVYPGKVRRGKEWEAFQIDNQKKTIVIQSEMDKIEGAVKSLNMNVSYLKKWKYQEHIEFQHDDITVHGYTDWSDDDVIIDLKVSDPNYNKFQKQIVNFRYCLQAYIYNNDRKKNFYWLVQSPEPPFCCRMYLAAAKIFDIGEIDFRQAIELFRQYQAGDFINDDNLVETMELPFWAIR